MLRAGDPLDVDGVVEVAQVLIRLADAVVLGIIAILDVGHAPGLVADELEGAAALALLLPLEADIVVLHGLSPSAFQMVAVGSLFFRREGVGGD